MSNAMAVAARWSWWRRCSISTANKVAIASWAWKACARASWVFHCPRLTRYLYPVKTYRHVSNGRFLKLVLPMK